MAKKNVLFINPMINGGGSFLVVGATVNHVHLFTFSDWTDEDLIAGMDRVKPIMVSLFPSQVPNLLSFHRRHSFLPCINAVSLPK